MSIVKQRVAAGVCVLVLSVAALRAAGADLALKQLEQALPRGPQDCVAERIDAVRELAGRVEAWAADVTWSRERVSGQQIVDRVRQLVLAKRRVDGCVDELLAWRGQFAGLPAGSSRREQLRQYLRCANALMDLSGRMQYLLRDAIDNATYALSAEPVQLDRMLDWLVAERVGIGAVVMTYALFDPPPASGVAPFPEESKRKVLRLIAVTRQTEALPALAQFVQQSGVPARLVVEAAEVIRQVGLPQDPLPGQEADRPAITASQLYQTLALLDASSLDGERQRLRQQLLEWLQRRMDRGIEEEEIQYGRLRLRAGDWLLMRNPSPYNLFTDLSPGLFTHVGIVAVHQDDRGMRRFVVVDLPERGDHIRATTVDAFLQRTLNYFFLRHPSEAAQRTMGRMAQQLIGHESQFDLTFRTDRVEALKGKPLDGVRINTYCAGLLLLCAQETGLPREEFFPIAERPAGGHCAENLERLGIRIGDNFVSPTGAVFSPVLEIVARAEPMYEPGREVREAIYDWFAKAMVERVLTPSPDLYQALRQKLAELSAFNPWLARALARAHGVSEHMDLAAAAKAAAVVETLDRVADSCRDGFYEARQAIVAGPIPLLQQQGVASEQLEKIRQYRQRHAELFRRWQQGTMTPRELRIELVRHYVEQGQRELEARFFSATP